MDKNMWLDYLANWRAKNKEKIRATSDRYRANNLEKVRAREANYRRKNRKEFL